MRLITRLLGGPEDARTPPSALPRSRRKPAAATEEERPAAEATAALERALDQVESMLGEVERKAQAVAATEEEEMEASELGELRKALRQVVQRLEEALDHLGMEGQRLADEVTRLTLLTERLEGRLDGLARLVRQGGLAAVGRAQTEEAPPSAAEEEPAAQEPSFEPGDRAVGVIIAAVPGFQGLMDVQRGLSRLPGVEGASVKRYQNGEASLEVMLRRSVTAAQIVEGLREATGHALLIEEARPEAGRLRLRFVDGDG